MEEKKTNMIRNHPMLTCFCGCILTWRQAAQFRGFQTRISFRMLADKTRRFTQIKHQRLFSVRVQWLSDNVDPWEVGFLMWGNNTHVVRSNVFFHILQTTGLQRHLSWVMGHLENPWVGEPHVSLWDLFSFERRKNWIDATMTMEQNVYQIAQS